MAALPENIKYLFREPLPGNHNNYHVPSCCHAECWMKAINEQVAQVNRFVNSFPLLTDAAKFDPTFCRSLVKLRAKETEHQNCHLRSLIEAYRRMFIYSQPRTSDVAVTMVVSG